MSENQKKEEITFSKLDEGEATKDATKEVNLNVSNEIIEQFEKIYIQNLDEMQKFEKSQFIFTIIGYLSTAIFFIMSAIKVQLLEKGFSYLLLLIPIYSVIISFTIYANLYLKLKDFFDRAQKLIQEDKSESGCSLGTFISYICLNLASICMLTYAALIGLKLENYMTSTYFNVIAVPIYLLIGICAFYFIFILPAFIFNKYYFPVAIITTYLVTFFIFFLMLNLKLDKSLNYSFVNIFTPVIAALSLHVLYLILRLLLDDCKEVINNLAYLIGVSLILTGTVLVSLKADSQGISVPNYLPLILYLASLLFLLDFKGLIHEDEETNLNEK